MPHVSRKMVGQLVAWIPIEFVLSFFSIFLRRRHSWCDLPRREVALLRCVYCSGYVPDTHEKTRQNEHPDLRHSPSNEGIWFGNGRRGVLWLITDRFTIQVLPSNVSDVGIDVVVLLRKHSSPCCLSSVQDSADPFALLPQGTEDRYRSVTTITWPGSVLLRFLTRTQFNRGLTYMQRDRFYLEQRGRLLCNLSERWLTDSSPESGNSPVTVY